MKKLIGIVGGLAILAWSGTASAETTLRAISFLAKNHPVMTQVNVWVNEVNEAMKGDLKINYVGGSEVVPIFQQPEALRNGVVDVLVSVTPYYLDQMPSGLAFALSKLSPTEERTSGFYDYMVNEHKKINARYLGRMHSEPFYLWTKKEPKKIEDLKGLKMRTGSLYDRFMQKLGMIPVTVAAPETYTALDSGVVDGFGWTTSGVRSQGWSKKANHVIDIPFFGASNVVALVNQNKWDALTPAQQKKLVDVTAAFEPKMIKFFRDAESKEWEELDKSGVKRVKFSAAENKTYLETAYDVEWAFLTGKVGAEDTAKLRKMTGN
jgi:TRAP-type C4-dicarboxylate transport system substrate-binding protein